MFLNVYLNFGCNNFIRTREFDLTWALYRNDRIYFHSCENLNMKARVTLFRKYKNYFSVK